MGFRTAFEALPATYRAMGVIVATVMITVGVMFVQGPVARMSALEVRVEEIRVRQSARLDSLAMQSLERTDRIRSEIRDLTESGSQTRRLLDELVCVLSAQAREVDPQRECRDPLPLVPVPDTRR